MIEKKILKIKVKPIGESKQINIYTHNNYDSNQLTLPAFNNQYTLIWMMFKKGQM